MCNCFCNNVPKGLALASILFAWVLGTNSTFNSLGSFDEDELFLLFEQAANDTAAKTAHAPSKIFLNFINLLFLHEYIRYYSFQ